MDQPVDETLICMNCGYDLRGTPGNICSECGKAFSREDYHHSLLPWERESSGHIRFLRTVLKVLFGRKISAEAFRNHDPARAFLFRRVVFVSFVLVMCLSHLGLMTLLQTKKTSIGQVLVEGAGQVLVYHRNGEPIPQYDFFLLYGMGLTGAWGWVLPLIVLPLMARDWVYGLGDALRMKTDSADSDRRANVLGCYLTAGPMFLLLATLITLAFQVVCMVYGVTSILKQLGNTQPPDDPILMILGIFPWLVAMLVIPVFSFIRLYQWRVKIYGRERVSFILTALKLVWIYLWRTFFLLLFIPCLIGFLRLCYQGLFVW